MTAVTHDSIAIRNTGVVHLAQPKRGFRFTSDSLLLVDFCRLKQRSYVLEPGAGTGVISLLLANKYPHARFVVDECEPIACDLLRKNIVENGFDGRISICSSDVTALNRKLGPIAFDAIIANPPYTKQGAGASSPAAERRTARQELTASIGDWIGLSTVLKNRGSYFLIFPAARLAELTSLLRSKKLEPKRLRCIHSYRNKPASLVMLESVKSAGVGLEIMPPLVVYETRGLYTREMADIYGLK